MAVQQAICNSFKLELLEGKHDFSSDVFRLALYAPGTVLGPDTTAYTSVGEVAGGGYVAAGEVTPVLDLVLESTAALVSFGSVTWTGATFTARSGLLYNASSANRAVAVLDFGASRTGTGGNFVVQMPPANAASALVRIL
jgi:hypothetical protein